MKFRQLKTANEELGDSPKAGNLLVESLSFAKCLRRRHLRSGKGLCERKNARGSAEAYVKEGSEELAFHIGAVDRTKMSYHLPDALFVAKTRLCEHSRLVAKRLERVIEVKLKEGLGVALNKSLGRIKSLRTGEDGVAQLYGV